MKKYTINFLFIALIFSSLFFVSCNNDETGPNNSFLIDSLRLSNLRMKDSLTRIIQRKDDSIAKAKQTAASIIFTVSVVNGTNMSIANGRTTGTQGLAGINVTVAQQGVIKTVTTDVSGQAVFASMNVGTVAVTVSGTGFTNVNIIAILSKPASSGTGLTYSSTIVPVYATSGASQAVVTGRVFANTDGTNIGSERLPVRKVIARLNGSSIPKFLSDNAVIQSRGYEGVVFTTTTAADGAYSFSLPAGSSGNNLTYSFDFEEFITDQKTGATTSQRRLFFLTTQTVAVYSEGIFVRDFFYNDVAASN